MTRSDGQAPHIIVCHHDAAGRERLAEALASTGHVDGVHSLAQAIDLLALSAVTCLIVDAPSDRPTRAALGRIAAAYPATRILVLAQGLSFEEARALIRIGVRDVLPLPIDPAACRDAVHEVLAERAGGAGPVRGSAIAVAAGKGGVGCTAIAVHLAAALASHGDVAVLDGDAPPFGTVATAGDLDPGASIAGLLRQRLPIEPPVLRRAAVMHPAGFTVFPLWSAPAELQEAEDAVPLALDTLLAMYPFVIIDVGRPVLPPQRVLLRRAAAVVAVATLDLLALRNLRHLVDLLAADPGSSTRLLPLLNRCDGDESYTAEQAAAALGQPFAAVLPHIPALRRCLDRGELLAGADAGAWPHAIARLAEEVASRRRDDVRTMLGHPAA